MSKRESLFFILALALPSVLAGAPPASCYTQNQNGSIPPIPQFDEGTSIDDPNNISQGPQGIQALCIQKWEQSASIPLGYRFSYKSSSGDNKGVPPTCADLAGDARNLAAQCPYGGVMQHWNHLGHKGNVFLEQIYGPNQPAQPNSWN